MGGAGELSDGGGWVCEDFTVCGLVKSKGGTFSSLLPCRCFNVVQLFHPAGKPSECLATKTTVSKSSNAPYPKNSKGKSRNTMSAGPKLLASIHLRVCYRRITHP